MHSDEPKLKSAAFDDKMIKLHWSGGLYSRLHPIWLCDNCCCSNCGDPAIGYRNLHLTSLDLNLVPQQLNSIPDQLDISWEDGHQSCYMASWLSEHIYDNSTRAARAIKPEIWNDAVHAKPPRYHYSEVVDNDAKLIMAFVSCMVLQLRPV